MPGNPLSEEDSALIAALVDSSCDAIIATSLDGAIRVWNQGAVRIYGHLPEDALGRPVSLLLTEDERERRGPIVERILKGERVEQFEAERLCRDGSRISVSLTISPIRNPAGEIIGISDIARNLTERNLMEAATAHLAAIVDSSDDAIVSKNLEGVILTWNAGAERLYGYTANEARWNSIVMLLPEDRGDEEAVILERLKRGERVEHFDSVRRRKDGSEVHVSLTISPIRDKDGKVRGASHVARDITSRRNAEGQMLQTQKLESLGVLAGGVAHDFNNLLVGILGNASLIADDLPATHPDRTFIDEVVAAAERAATLTRQLLAYAGKGQVQTEEIRFSALVREVCSLIHSSIPWRVRLELALDDCVPSIEGDPGQLQQVIMNLVINGAEAIGDVPGRVAVATETRRIEETIFQTPWGTERLCAGDYVVFTVTDSGSGMDQETRDRIFEPFFTTKLTGRGLGLAAVLGIVRGHAGALTVDSAPGQGSTFTVFFPAGTAMTRALPIASRRAEPGSGGTVLVIDDEDTVRTTARNALEYYGYKVLLAASGVEGIEIFRSSPGISLVLLDITMPVMNGFEVLDALRSLDPQVKVILSSGYDEAEAVQKVDASGVAFLKKPYTAGSLAEKIAQMSAVQNGGNRYPGPL